MVIPNLLEYRDSMVVLDIKQENSDLTYVSSDLAFRVSHLMSIAAIRRAAHSWRSRFSCSTTSTMRVR